MLNRTYEWLKHNLLPHFSFVLCWTVPMSDWNLSFRSNVFRVLIKLVEPYLWVIETLCYVDAISRYTCWTVPMSDWNLIFFKSLFTSICKCWTVPMSDWNKLMHVYHLSEEHCMLNRTYEWYFAFAELIVLYEYYELFC